jgi:uncharacterized membrane protein YcaP (DUF421 family)
MEIVFRTLVVFLFVLLLTRAMGKKELSQLTAFELILFVTIGDLVQQGVTQEDQSLTGAMLAVGTIGLLIVALSYVGYRWPGARSVIRGLPVVVLRNGEPDRAVLEVERLTLEELNEAAREQGISDLGEVLVAVLEPDGKFSFIEKDDSGETGQHQQPEKLSG